jgi:hypothetical protein
MAVCPCGYDYKFDPDHATCPKCGTSTQVFAYGTGARAVAHVFPPTVVAESNHPDGSREIVTGSYGHRSTARIAADGAMTQEYEGRPAQGTEDELQTCESLMEALKRQGVELAAKFRGSRELDELGIDARANTVDDDVIDVQVVQVRDGDLLAELGRTRAVSSSASADDLADDVCRRVERKRDACPAADRSRLVLLVDAIRAPGYTTPTVREALGSPPRADLLSSTGYRAIWLAGPTTALTFRLDNLNSPWC